MVGAKVLCTVEEGWMTSPVSHINLIFTLWLWHLNVDFFSLIIVNIVWISFSKFLSLCVSRKAIAKSSLHHLSCQPSTSTLNKTDPEANIRSTVDWTVSLGISIPEQGIWGITQKCYLCFTFTSCLAALTSHRKYVHGIRRITTGLLCYWHNCLSHINDWLIKNLNNVPGPSQPDAVFA